MNLGTRIKLRREELNMSQNELAIKLGYKSRSTINKIELGTRDRIETKLAFNHKGVKWLVNKLIKDGLLDRNVGILKLL